MIFQVSRRIGMILMIAAMGLILATLVIEATSTPGIYASDVGLGHTA